MSLGIRWRTRDGDVGPWRAVSRGLPRGSINGVVVTFGLLAGLGLGCGSSMVDVQGHRVFNPRYLFYLESSARDRWQMPDRVLDVLDVAPGQTVADVGAGGGYFTRRWVDRVGVGGRVFATDVQDVMVRRLTRRARRERWPNVTVIRSGFQDAGLPSGSCDLVFLSSVYKEISDRIAYMRRLERALKPGGRIAILEYRPETDAPGPPRRDRLPEHRVIGEMEAAGYELAERFEFLPREYFLVFRVRGVVPTPPST